MDALCFVPFILKGFIILYLILDTHYLIRFKNSRFLSFCCMLTLAGLLVGCSAEDTKIEELVPNEAANLEIAREVEVVYSEMGQIKARIIAPMMIRGTKDNDDFMEYPEGLTVYNYNAQMEIESKMSAKYGISHEKKEEVMVRDNVVLINIKGEKLNSEELWWSRKSKKITSDKFVKVTTIDEEIIGYGFDANEDFSEYTVRNVKMITTIDDPNVE